MGPFESIGISSSQQLAGLVASQSQYMVALCDHPEGSITLGIPLYEADRVRVGKNSDTNVDEAMNC